MHFVLSPEYSRYKNDIEGILKNFKNEGILVGNGNRNIVKRFDLSDLSINIKSFKQHNIINRHVYKYYRKSKAKRSYEYAQMLIEKKFFTPKPIAFIENHDLIGVTSSYYISEQLEDVFTLGDVLEDPNFMDREQIIRTYTQLIFQLHENGIEFIDNTSGNFLIKKIENSYQFYLVDLNRMNFHKPYEMEKRLKNFSRLTTDSELIKTISSEYASLSERSFEFCYAIISKGINKQQFKWKAKRILKFYKYLYKRNP